MNDSIVLVRMGHAASIFVNRMWWREGKENEAKRETTSWFVEVFEKLDKALISNNVVRPTRLRGGSETRSVWFSSLARARACIKTYSSSSWNERSPPQASKTNACSCSEMGCTVYVVGLCGGGGSG